MAMSQLKPALLASVAVAFAAPPSPAFAAEDRVIEEVVVTAQRREQLLSEVPLSVTALSSDYLDDVLISETRNLQFVTPGLNWSAQGPFSQPTIRGIGTSTTGLGNSPNVALYVDGVYNPLQMSGLFEFHNIERVEVLKGPQGTLFGRNSTGGAILIVTKDPSQTPEAHVSAGFGEYGLFETSGYVTGGLAETLAADLAYNYTEDDGYAKDIVTGEDVGARKSGAARVKFLYQPADWLEFVLALYHQDHKDDSPYATQAIPGATLRALAIDPNTPQPTKPFRVAHTFPPTIESRADVVNFTAQFELDAVTIKSITGWTDQDADAIADGDGSVLPLLGFNFINANETLQQEITLASNDNDGPLHWIVGGFYLDADNSSPKFTLNFGGVDVNLPSNEVDIEAWAIFGQISYDLTERLSLVAGLRYSDEERTSLTDGGTWDDLSPRVSVLYALTDTTNVYATYSEGFTSGTFDAGNEVNPEDIRAYEVGIKTSPTDRITVNAAAYYYEYDDIQVQAYIGSSTAVTQIQNAAEAEIQGLEAELFANLTDEFSVRLGAAYTDAEYQSFPGATTFAPLPAGGNLQVPADASGHQMIRTPDWTINAGLSYRTVVAEGELMATANVFFSDSYYWDVENRLEQDAYEMVNARVAWTTPNDRLRFSVWGENLTDELYGLWVGSTTLGDRVAYARPRTFGATVEFFWN